MADYYPLLSRAIAGLAGKPEADRHAIYGRAREALERQLRGFAPPIAEAEIKAELDSLESTIARIEAEQPAAVPEETIEQDESVASPKQGEAAEVITAEVAPAQPVMDLPSAPSVTGPSPFKALRPTVNDLPPKQPLPTEEITASREIPISAEKSAYREDVSPEDDLFATTLPSRPVDETLPAEEVPALQPMLRPRMPSRRDDDQTGRKKPLALFAGIAVVAMLIMGLIAMTRRDTPGGTRTPPVVVVPDSSADPSKTEGRLASSDVPGKPVEQKGPVSAPAQQPDTPKTATSAQEVKPAASPAATVTPSGNRAFMVLEVPGGAPNQFEGRTTWSFAPDASLKGQKTLRALIDFPNGGLGVDLSIARNADPAIGFSHTVMVIFDTRSVENVREMSAIEWRERESQAGTVLAGIVVPVQDNVFMLGLDKADAARARNLDLLRTQKWMVFEVRLANGRRGAVLVEKGGTGDKAIADALAEWK